MLIQHFRCCLIRPVRYLTVSYGRVLQTAGMPVTQWEYHDLLRQECNPLALPAEEVASSVARQVGRDGAMFDTAIALAMP